MFLMSRLLKIFIFCFFVSVFSPATPVRASSCSDSVPKPTSLNINAFPYDFPELNELIKQVQNCGGAASLVPAEVLKGIYFIESFPYYNNPSGYACKKNQYTALGLMQIVDGEYNRLVPYNQRLANDEGVCNATASKFSRCNPADAIEIVSRALLEKVNLWDYANFRPKGAITTKDQVFNATGHYYGLYVPDQYTNQLIDYLPEKFRYPSGHEYANTLTYSEFVCAFSGFCSSYQDYPYPRGWQPDTPPPLTPPDFNFSLECLHSISTGSSSSISTSSNANLLRPFPKQLVTEEKNRQIDDPNQTLYCAMRPTAVQVNRFDRRDEFIDIKTQGTLIQNFTEFITPLLSITDTTKPDYLLPYVDKAQRYLADYLEGRAYYEGVTEAVNPTPEQQADLFTRLGVFRKLAPKTYQDKLKRAVILRAAGQFSSIENPYGFPPATKEIHNYLVAEWSGSQVYLKDFVNNWAPLSEEFDQDQAVYAAAYEAWKNLDAGKWYQLWPYVPMFTREDSKGYIEIVDSNPPPEPWSPPGSTPVEINASNKKTVEVIHPHLSRTYEVSTSLSYLLTPESVHDIPTPETNNEWTPARWGNSIWWLDPSLLQPSPAPGLEYGPHCDVDNTIYSSGDLAYENIINTAVNRQDLHVQNPEYQGPPSQPTACGLLYPCERCIEISPALHYVDASGCFFSEPVRSNPDYLITHTPFLDKILTSTGTLSQRGIFAILKPYQAQLKPDEESAWPGLGNLGEESPKYSFSGGWAEAGDKKPGDTQSLFYRYLGSIQCAKERVMQVLQPFISNQPYTPYAYKCFPELTPPATGTGTGTGSVSCSQAVADRAKAIVDNLQRGFWGYFNKSPDYPELFDDALFAQNPDLVGINTNATFVNMFWCTWLVVKSFSESSSPILIPQLVTHNLTGYFQGEGRYIDANNITIQDVCPGMAIFFHIPAGSSSNAHVGIVYSVSSDGVTTVESNAPYKTMFYPVDESGHFQIIGSGDDTIEVSGFGTP